MIAYYFGDRAGLYRAMFQRIFDQVTEQARAILGDLTDPESSAEDRIGALVRMLRRHHPLWMSIHFTHPSEFTPEVTKATERLADAGIPLGSQTVLLKGINDDVSVMKSLMHGLLQRRVKPYYLYQCDPVTGSGHFRTTVEKGLEIMSQIRGFTSGYAVPTYVVDAPGGGGKIPLYPDPILGRDGDNLVLENYQGKQFHYPDPEGTITSCRRSQ